MFAWNFIGRILLVVLAILTLWALFANDSGASGPARHVTVRPGDTLWSIAVRSGAGDPREAVWQIQHRNHLDGSTITPGQVLLVP